MGIGFYEAAIAGAAAVSFVLTLLQSMDDRMHRKAKNLDIYIELSERISLGEFMRQVQEKHLIITNIQLEHNTLDDDGVRSYIASVKSPVRRITAAIIDDVRTIEGVRYIEQL